MDGLEFDFLPETELSKAKLLVLTPGFRIPAEQIRNFADNGGRILAAGLSVQELSRLNLSRSVERRVRLADYPNGDPLFRGLGNSDFYFNPAVRIPAFGKSQIVRMLPSGKGKIVIVIVKPADFAEPASQIKVKRILSVLLTNLGAPSTVPFRFTAGTRDIPLDGRRVPFRIDPESQGESKGWQTPGFDDSKWRKLEVGTHWEGQGITMRNPHYSVSTGLPYDGDAWYRIPVAVPSDWNGRELYFEADSIDDLDRVWFNGREIGHTGEDTPSYWEARRLYPIPADAVRFGGRNVIAVKVRDLRGNGGILGKVRIGGRKRESSSIFYERPSRLILDFDPNRWRQW